MTQTSTRALRGIAVAAAVSLVVACAARLNPSKPNFPLPETRAEATNYNQTSTYADVIAFMNGLRSRNAPIAFGVIGKTTDGRDIPYMILSRPMVTTPEQARALGRPIVYVNANIHAGEVEGKEALLALVRDLTYQHGPNVLDSLVLIAIPIYNADGNENFKDEAINRGEQNGPALVGQRPNGQGLDLNRDYIKAEAPETRAALAMFDKWDPDVYVDLHTTDGSLHGFALTYSPSLNPASYAPGFAGTLTRDTMLPEIRARMHNRGYEIFDYGNFGSGYGREALTDTVKNGWRTYEHLPRYGTNYYGIRGRISILSEAYSHDPFKRRVASTYAFVQEILSATARHSAEIERIRSTADNVQEREVPIRSQMTTKPFDAPIPFEVLQRTGDSTRTQAGLTKGIRRTGRFITQVMPVYDRFEPTLLIEKPDAYILPNDPKVIALLKLHGLTVMPFLPQSSAGRVSTFIVDSVVKSPRAFQGHNETRITGAWSAPSASNMPSGNPEGYVIVDATGRFGPLAAYILEPQSDDGLVDWNFLDADIKSGTPFPVTRLYK
ncbi:MAG: M14 family metallopeptidase [Gemmatimonadaceae bacterium]